MKKMKLFTYECCFIQKNGKALTWCLEAFSNADAQNRIRFLFGNRVLFFWVRVLL